MSKSHKVRIWTTSTVDDSTVDEAITAIEDLANQLDPITVTLIEEMGGYSGNTPHDTYDEYLDEFDGMDIHKDGWHSLLLYNRMFWPGEGGSQDAWPNLGASRHMARWDDHCLAIVNANILESESLDLPIIGNVSSSLAQERIFRNIVIHELLHSLLYEDNAPASTSDDDDHSYGEVYSPWWSVQNVTSPMTTGYSEPESNSSPEELCHGDPSATATAWTYELSSCTEDEAERWMDEEYPHGMGSSRY